MTEQPIAPRATVEQTTTTILAFDAALSIEGNSGGIGISIAQMNGISALWLASDRLKALEVAGAILEADLVQRPDHDQDGRFLALDALRGFITDQRDAADDEKVAAFYEGQYAAEGRDAVVSFSALPSEDKRLWRRKFQAAAVTVR